jgi:C4-dicarboxylate-specific signal transduction histidine kinase
VTIANTGCGNAEEHMRHLFEPFFTTKSPDQGAGLGLAVMHPLVTTNSGRIDIAGEVKRGTTVTITLPLTTGGHDG